MPEHPFTLADAWVLSGTLALAMASCACVPVPEHPCCVRCLCLIDIVAAGMAYAALGSLQEVF